MASAKRRATVVLLLLLCFAPLEARKTRKKTTARRGTAAGGGAAGDVPLGVSLFPEALSGAECDALLEAARHLPAGEGKIGGGGAGDSRTRRSAVRGLPRSLFEKVYRTVEQKVGEANVAKWKFTGLRLQAIQLGEYIGDDQGFYNWHVDQSLLPQDLDPKSHVLLPARSARGVRVLSATLQLSEPTNYTGGELLVGTGLADRAPAERGTLVVFPSYAIHTVRPLQTGTRFSLVIWFDGVDPWIAQHSEREQTANVAAIDESGAEGGALAFQLLARTQHALGHAAAAEESCRRCADLALSNHAEQIDRVVFCHQLLATTAFNANRVDDGVRSQQHAAVAVFGAKNWQEDTSLAGWSDPESLTVVDTLASMMSKGGNAEEALQLQRRCIAADPESAMAHIKLGTTLGKLGRLGEAEQAFAESSERATSTVEPQLRAEALAKHGLALAKLSRSTEALASARAALAVDPTYPLAIRVVEQLNRP